tara:strand:+ start:7181 stop:8767 length:1587 start_codon:yes stop_codon:yes gene_type:complete
MAGYSPDTNLTATRGGSARSATSNAVAVLEKTKGVSYNGTTSDQIFSISEASETSSTMGIPQRVVAHNTGSVPVFLMTGYETYATSDGADGATEYLHSIVLPGDSVELPVRALISADKTIIDGTIENNTKMSSVNSGLLWWDSTANLAAHVRPAGTNPITVTVGSNETNSFRVGDLIQIGRGTSQTDITEANYHREILRVESITDGANMVCERALYGTDAGDYDQTNWNAGHGIGQPVYLPFFNAYHDTDRYSVAQTDNDGKFKSFNFFGKGRGSGDFFGITPGSVCLKFYNPGYQNLGLSGITSSTESGLTASQQYKIDLTVDGGSLFQDLAFTVDGSNTKFGGSNGVLQKIQDALDAQYYTAGNLFEKGVSVAIVNGDIRFTSKSRLSTSAILLADTGDAYSLFDASAVGRIPALGDLMSPVGAKLPEDVTYDNLTFSQIPMNNSVYDDGLGNLGGMARGTINYETGAIDFTGAPANAEFVFSAIVNGAFSGKVNPSVDGRANTMVEICANTSSIKRNGQIKLEVF